MKITLTFDSWEDFETFCSDNRKDGNKISMTVKEKKPTMEAHTTPAIVKYPDPHLPDVPQEETPVPDTEPSVPTNEKTFVLDDLSKAAMTLMQSGKQAELSKLLSGYGVQSLRDLTPDQYGLFATGLRTLGAPI
ncbi:MAG: hypothetical protein IJI74_07350 [Firmicutes bacterium]|nr:hypothetical protein [Bacillota bacterium]